MKFFAALFLTALLCFIGGLYAPWWIIAPVAFLVALLIPQQPWKSWVTGFLAVFFTWGIIAFWIDRDNASLLSIKIGQLIGVGEKPFLLVILSGLVGGLVAGFAALSGFYLRTSKKSRNP
ncbi:MAG: hypothetical protein EOO09_11805 [Chitinophagaceae bacterium]|nr:MAG: hypothetical protein EOO09_11805 [Chitinophagaceae bacterium]